MSKVRYILLIGAIFLALVLSAVNTTPVFADESTPPSETSEETTNQETESAEIEESVEETEATSTEEEATESTLEEETSEIVDESQPSEEEQTPQTSGEPESAVEEESNPVTEILEQLPEGTEIVVLDENGEPVSLATQQAEESVSIADPRWCPAGVVPNNTTCSPSYESFLDLINWLTINNPAKAGVIWVDASYDSEDDDPTATDIILNGSSLTNMANYALTIQGGWLPAPGFTGKTVSATDFSEFHVPFKIIGWNAPVTINNISINGVNPIDSPDNDYALEVGTTKGNIILNNVEVINNEVNLAGAILTNNLALTPGAVTVNNSNFNSNTANGLEISSKGIVTLKNINANDNDDIGVSIDNTFDIKAQAVNLTGTNNFNYNRLDGLVVFSKGIITLNYITASYNSEGSGVYLDNCLQTIPGLGTCVNTFASSVVVKGINNFSYNGWDGLRVYSNGVISVSNIIANNNGTDPDRDGDTPGIDYDAYGKGVYLDNAGATTKRGVNVKGTNYFNNNISNGLFVISDGLITLTNLNANSNKCDQIKEGDSLYCAGIYLYSYGGVKQTGYVNVVDNLQDGLRITTFNTSVVLATLYAADNGKDGIHIDGGISSLPANITINGTNISNNNGMFGIWINTNGVIALNNITANYNISSGLYASNTVATNSRAIILKGVNTFQENGATGLTLYSRGAITTYSLNLIKNVGQGAFIDNCDLDVLLCQSYAPLVKKIAIPNAVKMLGINYINNNVNGVSVNSRGAITISNFTSIFNSNTGVLLRNDYDNAVGNVVISGTNNLSHNGLRGLEISSRGVVSVVNLTANYNDGIGAQIENDINLAKPVNVSFTGINRFNNNGETGLSINSYGVVTLSNITANGNGNPDEANGVFIDNAAGTFAKAVTLSGYNYFNDNDGTGLHIVSKGVITIQRVTANNNNGEGAYLNNEVLSGTAAVTVSVFGIFLNNADIGLQILSSGAVTASNLTANNNITHGVSIDTHYDPITPVGAAVNVTLNGINNFHNNGDNGLQINNDGAVTLTNIFASSNGQNGVVVDNLTYAGGTLNKAIVFNGVNNFSNNGEHGLMFNANGHVTLNRLTAFGNDFVPGGFAGSGIVGVFGGGGTNKTLTFNCGSLMGNEEFGMDITGATIISLKGVMLGQANDFHSATPVISRVCPLP